MSRLILAGKVLVASLSASILIFFGAGCKSEVGAENCEGKEKTVVSKYINDDNKPTLELSCGSKAGDRMYVEWEANNEDDKREWDNYSVGQIYNG